MWNRINKVKACVGLIDKTQTGIDSQKEVIIQKIREIFWTLADTAKKFSKEGNLDQVSDLLKELESAKAEINLELQKLQKEIQSQAGEVEQTLQNLAANLREQQGDSTEQQGDSTEQQGDSTEQQGDSTEQQGDSTRLIASPTEKKENFETTEDKKNKEKALNFIQTMITNQDTFESIKKKINEIKYTEGGIKIGPVQWEKNNYQNFYQIASKEDFERSFEWLFRQELPAIRKNRSGDLEYPRDRRIAVIPLLLGWEKKGRYGQDGKWHGVWKSGFYDLGDRRVLKFDHSWGTVREKRDADGSPDGLYVIK